MAGPAKSKKAPRKAGRKTTAEGADPGSASAAGEEPEGRPAGASAEALLARLDQVVRELEGGELPLEQALARFEEGVRLVRDGEQLLASVEQRIEILLADDRIVPFADEGDYADDDQPEAER